MNLPILMRSSALALALLLAAPHAARAQTEPHERAVYRAVLARFIEPETRRIVASDSTQTIRIIPSAAELLRERGAFLPDELLEQFNERNARRIALPDSLRLSVPVELVSEAEIRALQRSINQGEWDSQYNALRRHLPGSPGLVSLSRVGFSPEGDLALVHVNLRCGSRCGEGSWVLLRRRDGEWHIEKWITTIRS